MNDKALETFDGFMGGRVYDVMSRLTGFGPGYYWDVARALPLAPGMRVLDLGCGTASLGVAVAERIEPGGSVVGVDLAEKQLAAARRKVERLATPFELRRCSMDELPLEDASFDAVVTSLAMHAAPPPVRRAALRQVRRVLRPSGFFGLADWGRPRAGLLGLLWLPTLIPNERSRDNWNNAYPELCREVGMELSTDVYINSLVRCQVFRPRGPAATG
jgi:demethylmenaquinone methyltransferase/2-methoxy-6-polyprenyl-1,4-benzoquinol methylase